MTSVKGMVWGTPEFIVAAKNGENRVSLKEAKDQIEELGLLELLLSDSDWSELRSHVADEFELENTYRDCDCECF